MQLKDGLIKVVFDKSVENRDVFINSGVTRSKMSSVRSPWGFSDDAILAEQDWRRVTCEEMGSVVTDDSVEQPFSSSVGITSIPPDLLRSFVALGIHKGSTNQRFFSPADFLKYKRNLINNALRSEAYSELRKRLLNHFSPYNIGGGQHSYSDLFCEPSGLEHVTENTKSGGRLGLHIDSFDHENTVDRSRAFNRICVNFGSEDRFLLFINLSYSQIVAELERVFKKSFGSLNPSIVVKMFLHTFPNYPVLSIKLRPGDAYIAPTENVIHDGSSFGQSDVDICFTMWGFFRPNLAKRSFNRSMRFSRFRQKYSRHYQKFQKNAGS